MEIQVKIESVHIHIPGMEQVSVVTGDQLKTGLESLYKAISGMMLNSEARIMKYIEEHTSIIRVGIKSLDDLDKCTENLKEPSEKLEKVAVGANMVAHPVKKVAPDEKKLTSEAKTAESKVCVKCGNDYKPKSNAQKKCEDCSGRNKPTTDLQKQKKAVQNERYSLKKKNKLTPEKEAELEAVLNEIALSQKKTYVISK